MLIYNYHPDSGEFMGTSQADAAPWNSEEFLIPANATTEPPPEGGPAEGHAITWNGKAWVEVGDHRGEIWWNADGQPMTINQIGDPLDHGLVAEAPEPRPKPEPPAVARIRFALVHNEIVLQVLEAECPMQWQLFEGCRMVVDGDALARPGYSYDGTTFQKPPPPPEPIDDAA